MSRTTYAELKQIVRVINNMLDTDQYDLSFANSGVRLVRDGGAREVSPRLSSGELAQWMRAFIAGIEAGQLGWEHSDEDSVNGTLPLPDTGAGASVEAYRG
jgi:hypothetical protein